MIEVNGEQGVPPEDSYSESSAPITVPFGNGQFSSALHACRIFHFGTLQITIPFFQQWQRGFLFFWAFAHKDSAHRLIDCYIRYISAILKGPLHMNGVDHFFFFIKIQSSDYKFQVR